MFLNRVSGFTCEIVAKCAKIVSIAKTNKGMEMTTINKNDDFLVSLGFLKDERIALMFLPHPNNSEFRLIASQYFEREDHKLNFFTEFNSLPANMPGDPKNICIGVPNHDNVFLESVSRAFVEHFISLDSEN